MERGSATLLAITLDAIVRQAESSSAAIFGGPLDGGLHGTASATCRDDPPNDRSGKEIRLKSEDFHEQVSERTARHAEAFSPRSCWCGGRGRRSGNTRSPKGSGASGAQQPIADGPQSRAPLGRHRIDQRALALRE